MVSTFCTHGFTAKLYSFLRDLVLPTKIFQTVNQFYVSEQDYACQETMEYEQFANCSKISPEKLPPFNLWHPEVTYPWEDLSFLGGG